MKTAQQIEALLAAEGLADLQCGSLLSRKGTSKVPTANPVKFSESAAYFELAAQLLEDPATRWPSPMHKVLWRHHSNGLGRVEIERLMGDAFPGWRVLRDVVAWGNQQLKPTPVSTSIPKLIRAMAIDEVLRLAACFAGEGVNT